MIVSQLAGSLLTIIDDILDISKSEFGYRGEYSTGMTSDSSLGRSQSRRVA